MQLLDILKIIKNNLVLIKLLHLLCNKKLSLNKNNISKWKDKLTAFYNKVQIHIRKENFQKLYNLQNKLQINKN